MNHDHSRTASRCATCGATPRQLLRPAADAGAETLALCKDCQDYREAIGALESDYGPTKITV